MPTVAPCGAAENPMPSALIDTSVLLDYLAGEPRAKRAIELYAHRSISVVTWLELMAHCPPALLESTRGFLRSFERLSVSESIADEALRLMHQRSGLPLQRALTWAAESDRSCQGWCSFPTKRLCGQMRESSRQPVPSHDIPRTDKRQDSALESQLLRQRANRLGSGT
jgi:hypothetical protein